jgi:hypothetical protein
VHNTKLGEEGIKFPILSSLIGLDCKDLTIELSLNKSLEVLEFLKHFRFKFDEIYPSKSTEIIHKAHIIFLSSY